MNLWLDDQLDPKTYSRPGWEWVKTTEWVWVKTAHDAIELLKSGSVNFASLDHDLGEGNGTGYDVVLWMEENAIRPRDGVTVHSRNTPAAQRMMLALSRPKYLP